MNATIKTSIKTMAAAIALSTLMAGPASAMILKTDINRALSTLGADSNINATISESTVTLMGYYSDIGARNKAIRAAKNTAGVERVINRAFKSS